MKKITLLFVVIFAALSAMAQTTYSHTFASGQLKNGSVTLSNVAWNFSMTGSTYFGWDSNNGKGLQMGKSKEPATSIVLSSSAFEGKVTKVTLNTSGASGVDTDLSVTVGGVLLSPANVRLTTTATDYTFTGEASGEIVITWTNKGKAIYIKSLSVVTEAGTVDGPKVLKPIMSVASKKFSEPFDLTLSCATEGAKIYYTLTKDGTFVEYTSAINIKETTTVYAKAVLGTDESEVASATYTYVNPVVTIADFLKAEENDGILYELTGVVYDIYNTQYGNFYLTNETDTVLVYGLKANATAGNQSFAEIKGLEEGDTLTLRGYRSAYNGKPQVGSAYYVSHKDYVEPIAITATWDIEEGDTIEDFTSATLTFTGVESAKAKSTYSNYFFYKVAEDGTATLVPSACNDGYMDAAASGTAVTFSIDKETCYLDMPQYGAMFGLTTGKYRIAVPVGAIQFNGDASNLNTEAYVLNFTYVAPKAPTQVEAAYTVNPENNSTVAEVREVVINFTEYETIKVAEPDLATGANIPTVSTYMEDYGMSMPAGYMMFKADSLSANGLRLYVDPRYTGGMEAFVTEGLYTISIPAGVVSFGSDSINQTITLTYTVGQVEEELPMEVEFENIAAIYEMGMWDMAYYESYNQNVVKALLKSQPTVVDKVVTSGMMGGSMNNYYLNDGTGVIVLQAEGDRIEPIVDENWEQIGNDTIPGLNIEIGKKLPANFFATIDFKTVIDDETYLPTGEVYGAPVMAYVPRETGDTIVDEFGWETIVTESNEDFAARCEASDFVEEAVEVSIDDLLANRIDYAGKLVVVDTTGNYYAESMMDHFSGVEKTTAYMYCGEATESFDVESYEEEGTTYVYVYPKYTEDNNNFAGTLFNLAGGEFTAAALDANVTIDMAKARFDWNSIAQGQSMIVKEYQIVTPGPGQDVDNSELVVNIYSNNGSVYVETEAGAMIEVYTVNGLRVYAGVSNTNTTVINGLNTNIAIIRVNGEAYKVFVK
jgi:hypothetical protein